MSSHPIHWKVSRKVSGHNNLIPARPTAASAVKLSPNGLTPLARLFGSALEILRVGRKIPRPILVFADQVPDELVSAGRGLFLGGDPVGPQRLSDELTLGDPPLPGRGAQGRALGLRQTDRKRLGMHKSQARHLPA